jgi:hypothetical protein
MPHSRGNRSSIFFIRLARGTVAPTGGTAKKTGLANYICASQ